MRYGSPCVLVLGMIYIKHSLWKVQRLRQLLQDKWKWNESGFRPPLCTYRLNWARRTSWGWWEMNEMTLSYRHRIRNLSLGGLRPSTLPLGHGGSPQYWVSHVDGEETFCFFRTAKTGSRTPNSSVRGSGAYHYPGAPAPITRQEKKYRYDNWT